MIRLIAQSVVELFLKIFIFLSAQRVDKIRHKPASYALDAFTPEQTIKDLLNEHPGQSGVYLLENNIDAFIARCNLIDQAQQTLDLQYYSFQGDTSGKLIAQALVKAADRGVRVRVLLDDIDTLGADEAIRFLNAYPSIEIRIFNPFYFRGLLRYLEFIVDLSRVGRRMHNKVMIADNVLAIVGGRNISDVYFSADPDLLFLDVDLLTLGELVKSISIGFDEYWNSRWSIPVAVLYGRPKRAYALNKIKAFLKKYQDEIKQLDYVQTTQTSEFIKNKSLSKISFIWSRVKLFYDRPDKIDPGENKGKRTNISQLKNRLHDVFAMAKEELTIISPYFVPGEEGVKWFESLIGKGIKVNVFTNSLAATDVTAVHAGYEAYRKSLLEVGVNLFELKATAYVKDRKRFKILHPDSRASLHAKTVIIDRCKVFMGSPNLDPRSTDLNTEIGLFIDNEELSNQLLTLFSNISSGQNSYSLMLKKNDISNKSKIIWQSEEGGKLMQYTSEPEVGVLRKLKVYFFSLLPIEHLL
jgi:cardiolipin synthase C